MCFKEYFNESNNLNFERCGEIIVSTRNNVLAIVCVYCNDIFMHTVGFMRHLQLCHDDVLRFSNDLKNNCVYTVEELLENHVDESLDNLESSLSTNKSEDYECQTLDCVISNNVNNVNVDKNYKKEDVINPLQYFDKSLAYLADIQTADLDNIRETDESNDENFHDIGNTDSLNLQYFTDHTILEAFKRFDISPDLFDKDESIESKQTIIGKPIKQNELNSTKDMNICSNTTKNKRPTQLHNNNKVVYSKDKNEVIKFDSRANDHKESKYNQELNDIVLGLKLNTDHNNKSHYTCFNKAEVLRPKYFVDKKNNKNELPEEQAKITLTHKKNICKRNPDNDVKAVTKNLNKIYEIEHIVNNKIPPKDQEEIMCLQPSAVVTATNTDSNISNEKEDNVIQPSNRTLYTLSTDAKKTSLCKAKDSKSCTIQQSQRKEDLVKRMQNIKKQIHENLSKHNSENLTQCVDLKSSKQLTKIINDTEMLQKTSQKRDEHTPFEELAITKIENFTQKNSTNNVQYKLNQNLTKLIKSKNKITNQIIDTSGLNCKTNFPYDDKNEITEKLAPIDHKVLKPYSKINQKSKVWDTFDNESQIKNQKNKKIKCSPNNSSDLDNISLVLSESVDKFLEDDIKNEKLSLSNLLEECSEINNTEKSNFMGTPTEEKNIVQDSNILEELMKQMKNEDNVKQTNNSDKLVSKQNSNNETYKDIELLNCVGLKPILCPADVRKLTLEQENQIQAKASKMANLIQKQSEIWCTRVGGHRIPEKIYFSFKQLAQETNKTLNLQLSMSDLKRIVNLVTIWYTEQCNNKLIDKRNNLAAVQFYEKLFSFIPKTARRQYYCEFCSEIILTESKYLYHRTAHTGINPYKCKFCGRSFKIKKSFMKHELSHSIKDKVLAGEK